MSEVHLNSILDSRFPIPDSLKLGTLYLIIPENAIDAWLFLSSLLAFNPSP
jgi:hypothetical protein